MLFTTVKSLSLTLFHNQFGYNIEVFISYIINLTSIFNRPFVIFESINLNKDFVWPPEVYLKDLNMLLKYGSISASTYIYDDHMESFNFDKVCMIL